MGERLVAPGQPCPSRPLPGRRQFWHSLALARAHGAGFSCWRLQAASPPWGAPTSSFLRASPRVPAQIHLVPSRPRTPRGSLYPRGQHHPKRRGSRISRERSRHLLQTFMITMRLQVCIRGGERRENLHVAAAWWAGELPWRLRTAFIPLLGVFLGHKRVQTPLPIPCPACCRLPEGRALPWL